MTAAKIPEVTGGRDLHFVIAGEPAMLGIRKNPGALIEISGNGGVAPAVTVSADFAVAIEIIEQDIIAGQLMLIGRYFFDVHAEVGIAVPDRFAFGVFEIAKDLIVGAIFFDDVEDVDRKSTRLNSVTSG